MEAGDQVCVGEAAPDASWDRGGRGNGCRETLANVYNIGDDIVNNGFAV